MNNAKLRRTLAMVGTIMLWSSVALAATSNVAQLNTLYTSLLALMPVIGAICMIAGGTGAGVMWMFGMREFGTAMFFTLGMFIGGIFIAVIGTLIGIFVPSAGVLLP